MLRCSSPHTEHVLRRNTMTNKVSEPPETSDKHPCVSFCIRASDCSLEWGLVKHLLYCTVLYCSTTPSGEAGYHVFSKSGPLRQWYSKS